MTDQRDKMTQYPPEDQILADASKGNSLITDINELVVELRQKRKEFTPEYISEASRESLMVRKQEFNTAYDLLTSKIAELSKEQISQAAKDGVKAIENETLANRTYVMQMIGTSKYAIADERKKELSEIYNKMKDIRAIVTADFLHTASIEALGEMRSNISALQTNFMSRYQKIEAQNLEEKDIGELVQQKADVESATPGVDRIIQSEINAKQSKLQSTSTGQTSGRNTSDRDAQLAGSSGTQSQTGKDGEQIQSLQEQVKNLLQREKATAETIESLEQKLLSARQDDLNSSMEIFEEEPMVGDPPPTDSRTEQGAIGLKIGSIDIPTFSGNLEDWEPFKDLFEHLVHQSKRMSHAVKFYQLRTHLKGAALDTIRGYQVTGHNYEAAWTDLKNRYNRTDELIEEYIRKFFESRSVEGRPNFIVLRKIIDSTNQMRRALPNLGASVENWDPIINLIIGSKLNEELRSEWAQKRARENLKSTTDFLTLLESKAIELQPKQSDRLSQMLKGDTKCKLPPRKVFQITEKKPEKKNDAKPVAANKKECILCKGNHHVWDCNMLKKESAKARTGIIRALGLCFKCLLKHRVGMCDNDDCEYCGGAHHVMICYKKENEEKLKPAKPRGQPPRSGPPGGPKPSTSYQQDEWEDWNPSAVKKN